MTASETDLVAAVRAMFERARFVGHLGVTLVDAGPGWCETELASPAPELQQQNGYLHAGVMATMADHTAGGAVGTRLPAGQGVLSIEFKINFLHAARGRLRCRADTLRCGRSVGVAEASIFANGGDGERHVAKALVTLAVVPWE